MSFFTNGNNNASLTNNIDEMSQDQLKERLVVAETMMKKLFNRNKELENFVAGSQKTQMTEQTIQLTTEMKNSTLEGTIEDQPLKTEEINDSDVDSKLV